MLPDNDLSQRWVKLESVLTQQLGKKPCLDDILFFIGVQEAGLPPKDFTENEKMDVKQVALCSILVPARYYELMWVEDTGWPHFKQLRRLPPMDETEREEFLKPYVLLYAEKNKIIQAD